MCKCRSKVTFNRAIQFKLEDKQLRRAGLDYHEFADLKIYKNFAEFYQQNKDKQIWACTTKAKQYYHKVDFSCDDILLLVLKLEGYLQMY